MPAMTGRVTATCLAAVGTLAGLWGSIGFLLGDGAHQTVEMAWSAPAGTLLFSLDPLSAFFLIPVLLVAFCVSLYSCGYCATTPESRGETLLALYLGFAVAAIILLLLSANGVTFLLFWEAMALSVFLAMCLEHAKADVREAGMHYLAASHVATIALFVTFVLIPGSAGGQFPAAGSLGPAAQSATAIFFVSLFGFGIKAGIMPLHVWLPGAHANAPGHISALMSGIVIKTGIYGLLRVLSFYGAPPLWWGILLLAIGVVSAVIGVLFAIAQHDIKRLLAYHSIENIGIIVMGAGVALIGLSSDNRILFVLGMAAALLHVLNHALFKSLLFLSAVQAVHAAGTREIDRMGGLSRAIPVASTTFLIGAVAICGLPPLNGFISEFLLYLGMFKGFGTSSGAAAALLALAPPALALTGGLALACFVKVYGIAFLGVPRAPLPEPHEHPATGIATGILAVISILIGVLPFAVTPLIEPVVASLFPREGSLLPSLLTAANLYDLGVAAAVLLIIAILLVVFYAGRLTSRPFGVTGTWDCGYAAPAPSMQYTASSFSEMLLRIFKGVLRPERHEPETAPLFPGRNLFSSHVPELVLDTLVLPFCRLAERWSAPVRRLQNGRLNHYILYIFVAVILLLALSCRY
jgi:hydrogenase-4 component B